MRISIQNKEVELYLERDYEDGSIDLKAAIVSESTIYCILNIKPNGAVKTIGSVNKKLGLAVDPGGHLIISSS